MEDPAGAKDSAKLGKAPGPPGSVSPGPVLPGPARFCLPQPGSASAQPRNVGIWGFSRTFLVSRWKFPSFRAQAQGHKGHAGIPAQPKEFQPCPGNFQVRSLEKGPEHSQSTPSPFPAHSQRDGSHPVLEQVEIRIKGVGKDQRKPLDGDLGISHLGLSPVAFPAGERRLREPGELLSLCWDKSRSLLGILGCPAPFLPLPVEPFLLFLTVPAPLDSAELSSPVLGLLIPGIAGNCWELLGSLPWDPREDPDGAQRAIPTLGSTIPLGSAFLKYPKTLRAGKDPPEPSWPQNPTLSWERPPRTILAPKPHPELGEIPQRIILTPHRAPQNPTRSWETFKFINQWNTWNFAAKEPEGHRGR
ncbi:uncharacterized protein GJ701_015644 [Geothlypis trichas]